MPAQGPQGHGHGAHNATAWLPTCRSKPTMTLCTASLLARHRRALAALLLAGVAACGGDSAPPPDPGRVPAQNPAAQDPGRVPGRDALLAQLAAADPDAMSPRAALELLFDLKERLRAER